MQIHPLVEQLGAYPLNALADARAERLQRGEPVIDFGIGEPHEPTPQFIRDALIASVTEEQNSRYPSATGTAELREAIAGWAQRRYGVVIDPSIELLPTLGSKEAIFHLAAMLCWAGAERNLIAVTTPGYPVPARSALLAGAELLELPLDRQAGWLPDIESITDEQWRRLAIIWITSPNSPTGSVASREFYEQLAERCRRNGVVLASDEAYSEIYFDEPPPSVLQVSDPTHVLAFSTLSKRSSMPGYRSGAVCGDPLLIGAMRQLRPTIGLAPQHFVQAASVAAWNDQQHVDQMRARYAAKRKIMIPALDGAGYRSVGGPASFYLWCEAGSDGDDQAAAARLLEKGLLVAPGSLFGSGGEGYLRLALVPTLEQCEQAAAALNGQGL